MSYDTKLIIAFIQCFLSAIGVIVSAITIAGCVTPLVFIPLGFIVFFILGFIHMSDIKML
jgi:hypothetical protein